MHRVRIAGVGAFAPDKRLTNADLEKIVETSDEWIVERTGIRERRISAPDQPTSALAAEAARRALEDARVKPEDIDTILVATSTPDRLIPPTAIYVQRALQCWNAGCADIVAACSGFTYLLHNGSAMVAMGRSKACLLIGAEELTKVANFKDRNTCVLFGDAAGAVVLTPSDGDSDILYSKVGADGRLEDLIIAPAFGNSGMALKTVDPVQNAIQMKGREVYKFAVPKFVEIIREALDACRFSIRDVTLFIPHQMNARMIEAVAQRLEFPMERVFMNIDRYGNTSAASIPTALDEAVRAGRVRRGDILLFSAMGAGLTWGTVVVRW
ncbi:MAG: ketoacyl-ACP synthase III [Planctomycetes bacterium]|nr:ketoacyl-ACP synthase III [Planctomycetota bacterium]